MKLKIVIKNTTRKLLQPWLNVFNQGEELPSRRYDLDWLRDPLGDAALIRYSSRIAFHRNHT